MWWVFYWVIAMIKNVCVVVLSLLAGTVFAETEADPHCQAPVAFAVTNENAFNITAICSNEQYAYRFWIGTGGTMPVENVFFTNTSHVSNGRCDFTALQAGNPIIRVALTNLWDAAAAKKYCGDQPLKIGNGQLRYATTYTRSIVLEPQQKSPPIDVSSNLSGNHLIIVTSPKS